MKRILILVPVLCVALTACELPDTEGLNKTPQITAGLSDKMTEVERLTKLKAGKDDLENSDNYYDLSPIPEKLMAGGKLFGENATNAEIVDYVYLKLNALREVMPTKGLDEKGEPLPYTKEEIATIRVHKMGVLYALMTISTYMQDSKVTEMVNTYIYGNHNRRSTALAILALRAFFIREIYVKESLKIDSGKPEVLETSGAMSAGIEWMNKVDAVSSLDFSAKRLEIKVSVVDKTGNNLINFEEVHNEESRRLTKKMWETALDKAKAGMQQFSSFGTGSEADANELAAQQAYINAIDAKVQVWHQKVN